MEVKYIPFARLFVLSDNVEQFLKVELGSPTRCEQEHTSDTWEAVSLNQMIL